MATQLEQFVNQYRYMASVRGLTPSNPVNFQFTPNASDTSDVYRLIVSYTEPSFADVPYNVLWLDVNPGSPYYKSVLLRTSHVTDTEHRASWRKLEEYANLFKSKQFFRFVVENASDLGIDVGELAVPRANTRTMGTVMLDPNNPEADNMGSVAVSDSDPRMTDNRDPNAHEHDDYPRTMIRLNSTAYVEVTASNMPQEGYVLAIVASDPNDRNRFVGKWVKPTVENVEWNSPQLLGLSIRVPGDATFISDNSSIDLIGIAEFENDVITDPEGLVWSISDNDLGITIDPVTGVVTAPDLASEATVQVTVKMVDPVYGNTVEATIQLRIKNLYVAADTITRIDLVGPSRLHYKQSGSYTVTAHYASGQTILVKPETFTTADGEMLRLIDQTGVGGLTETDQVVTLTATFTDPNNNQVLTDTLDVTIVAQLPKALTLKGAAVMDEQTTETYIVELEWANGDVEQVEPTAFVAAPSEFTTISGLNVTAADIIEDQNVVLTAKYLYKTDLLTSDLALLIRAVEEPPVPVSIEIKGPNTIDEGKSATYQFEVTYDDNTKNMVTIEPGKFYTNNAVVTIVDSTVTAEAVTQDTVATLVVEYTENGMTVTNTFDVTVLDLIPAIVLESLEIVGPTTMEEKTSEAFTVIAHFSDNTTDVITPDSFTILSGSEFGSLSGQVLSTLEVTKNESITLSASYAHEGVTKTDTHKVTVTDVYVPPTLVGIEILGLTNVAENSSATYTVNGIYSDSSRKAITPSTFSADNGGVTIVGLTATMPEVDADTTFQLYAGYNDGTDLHEATLDVTIIDQTEPVVLDAIEVVGPTQLAEGGATATYTVNAHYSDGSSKQVTPSSFSITSGGAHATLSGMTVTSKAVTSDQNVVLTASYSENGVTKSDTHTVVIKYSPPTIARLVVSGPTQMDEQSTVKLTAQYEMSDGSFTPATVTWTWIQGNAFGEITASGNLTAYAVTKDETILLRVDDGQGRTYDHTMVIKNSINVTPTEILITGPTTIPEETTAQFTGRVKFSNGTSRDLTAGEISGWAVVTGMAAASVSATGLVTTKAVSADTQATLELAATVDTLTQTVQYVFTVQDRPDEAKQANIKGAARPVEKTTETYTVEVELVSGAKVAPDRIVGWSSDNTIMQLQSADGDASVWKVGSNATGVTINVELSCTAYYAGQQFDLRQGVQVLDTIDSVKLTEILGPDQIEEGQSGTYSLRITRDSNRTEVLSGVVFSTDKPAVASVVGNTVTAGFVDADTVVKVTGTATVDGEQVTANKNVTVKNVPPTITTFTIEGPTQVESGGSVTLAAKAYMSDATIVTATDTASWSVQSTGGVPNVTVNKGVVNVGTVTADATVTIRASYSGKVDTHDITVKKSTPAESGPRFGILPKVTSVSAFNQAFLDSLTTNLTSEGEQVIKMPGGSSTMANNKFGYVAWPKSLGYGYFRDFTGGTYGFAGSWDGAMEMDDFNFMGPAEVNIGGVDYVIYRNDFPFENVPYDFSILYGSSNALSGQP